MCLVVRAVASYKSIQQSGLMTWLAAAVQGDEGLMVSQSIYVICMHVALSSRASSKPKGKIHTWELLMTLNPYISELFINSIRIRLGFTPRMYIIVQGLFSLNNMDGRGFNIFTYNVCVDHSSQTRLAVYVYRTHGPFHIYFLLA